SWNSGTHRMSVNSFLVKPTLPAPHQVAVNFFENTFLRSVTSNRSLVYNAWVTLSSTLLGFAFGTALGIVIAVGIV
ncbi:MAG: hypothetical protein E5W03_25570, partial [Mesorhizobium sp.]